MGEGKKVLFFDIDNTLLTRENVIPDSTVKALRKLKENGHLLFLCSGRGRAYIRHEELLNLDFDGIISGCGTMVEYRGQVVFLKSLEQELVDRTLELFRQYRIRPILEGWEVLYFDEEDFGEDPYGKKLKRELGDRRKTICGHEGPWNITKYAIATEPESAACFELLKEEYDFLIHNPFVAEVVPKGYNKGTGILKTLEILGMDAQDAYAFGDSVNDLEMFHAVGTSVCMGNGSDVAKAAADYVTDSIFEDGIWNACVHFQLI